MYIGQDGARYEVTKYPLHIDSYGILQTRSAPVETLRPEAARSKVEATTSTPDLAGTSGLNETRPSPFDSLFKEFHINEDDFGHDWKPVREIKVVKVFQDNILQEVFRDSTGVYYATTRLPHLQFIVQHTLYGEQAGFESRIKDQSGNQF